MLKTLLLMGAVAALFLVVGCHKSEIDDGTPKFSTPPPKTGKAGPHGTPTMTRLGQPPTGSQTPGK